MVTIASQLLSQQVTVVSEILRLFTIFLKKKFVSITQMNSSFSFPSVTGSPALSVSTNLPHSRRPFFLFRNNPKHAVTWAPCQATDNVAGVVSVQLPLAHD